MSDEKTPGDSELDALVGAARRERATADARARLAAKLPGGPSGGGAHGPSSGGAGAAASGWAGRAALAAAAITLVALVAWVGARRTAPPATSVDRPSDARVTRPATRVAPSQPTGAARGAPASQREPSDDPGSARATPVRPRRALRVDALRPPDTTPTPVAPPSTSATDELRILTRARSLAARQPAEALALVRQHEAQFRDSQFAQEREAIAIEALVSSGRVADARARATRFDARWPSSPLRERIARLLRATPESSHP